VTVPVYLEVGAKRVFAGALEWPGWIRAGKTEEQALDALAGAAPRYAAVAVLAGLSLPAAEFEVVERLPGDATTDFGAPSAIPEADRRPLTATEAKRLADLVAASWSCLQRVAAGAPAELRKGPRGGGRDRDKIVGHVIAAEEAYAAKLGIRRRDLPAGEGEPGSVIRRALMDVLAAASTGEPRWPPRYAARRIAWHALDHAWEIEDRSRLEV
jgi:predicted RNase H-like HicB family nuclease